MIALSLVNALLEDDTEDLGDLMHYAFSTPEYLERKQKVVEIGLAKLGFKKRHRSKADIAEFGPEVVVFDRNFGTSSLCLTRTMNDIGGASRADPIWAVDSYAYSTRFYSHENQVPDHGHAGVLQSKLLAFMNELLNDPRSKTWKLSELVIELGLKYTN